MPYLCGLWRFANAYEYTFVERSNEVRTDREKLMGQHVDYKL